MAVNQQVLIQFKMDATKAINDSQEFESRVERLKIQLQDVVTQSKGAGVAFSTIFQNTLTQFDQQLAKMQSRNAMASKVSMQLPFSDKEIKAAKDEIAALQEAYSRLTSEFKTGRSEAIQYSDSLEQIGKAADVSVQKASQDIAKLEQQFRNLKKTQPDISMQQYSQQLIAAFKANPIQGTSVEEYSQRVTTAMKNVTAETLTANDQISVFGMNIGRLGDIARLVFGGTFAILAVNALKSVIRYFEEAGKAGIEYAQDLLRLRVATNILQENGLNITMKDVLKTVNELNQAFPLFTRKSIVEGVSYMSLLVQNLGLTNDQMSQLNKISASLAVVMGKDFNDAAREVALFLSSGYGEALQKTGILASRAAVSHELLKEGIQGGYTRATDIQRAFAAYNVLLQQSNGITSRATEIQKDQAFALTRLATAWENLKNSIGAGLAPNILKVADGLAWVIEQVHTYYNAFKTTEVAVVAGALTMSDAFKRLGMFIQVVSKNLLTSGFDIRKTWDNIFQGLIEDSRRHFQEGMAGAFPDLFPNMKDQAADASKGMQEANDQLIQDAQEMGKEVTELQKKFKDENEKLEQQYQDDMAKIDKDGAEKRLDIFNKFLDDVTQISVKAQQDITDATTKYNRDVADVNRQFAQQRAQAEQKYRDNELKAERDFQEKMRRLREDFILNLEDAVRERDALQIIRLTRKYNLDRDRLLRDNAEETRTRKEAFARETRDAEAQKNERLRQLKEELDARIADINLNKDREIAARTAQYKQEQADLEVSLQKQRDERLARYDQQQEDLKKSQQDQIDSLVENWMDQYNHNKEGTDRIKAALDAAIGPSGTLSLIWSTYFAALKANSAATRDQLIADSLAMTGYMQAAASGMIAPNPQSLIPPNAPQTNPNWSGAPTSANSPNAGTSPFLAGYGLPQSIIDLLHRLGVPDYAEGGTIVATKPTLAMFGERGMERASFTPANRMSSMMGNGKVTVALDLSPDLEARIVDNTLNEMAEVIVSVGGKSR